MLLTVVHVDGSKRGQTETFENALVAVGRDPANQLVFDPFKDQDVSAKHAQFVIQGDKLLIQDLKSRNGTFVNGSRVGDQPIPVPDGAVVQFGDKGPKIQISFRAAPSGPGKKTQMIADLEGRLEKQQSAGSKKMACVVVAMLLIAGVLAGGIFLYLSIQKRKDEQNAAAESMANVPGARKAAENVKAPDLASATFKSAQDAEAAAETDQKAKNYAAARKHFDEAIDLYKQAKSEAERAELKNQIAALNEALQKKTAEKQEKQAAEDVERQKELDRKKAETEKAAQEQVNKLKAELDATKTLAELRPLVEAAVLSSKIPQVESVLDKVKQQETVAPSDQLKEWRGKLEKRLDELKALSPRLDKAAQDVKTRIVAIQATSYMLPKNQTEKTTQIREFLTSVSGTGFFVGKDKIATAKELVEPWKFDPAALALKKRIEAETPYKVATKIDVLTLNADGVYAVTATNDPTADNPTVEIGWLGSDSYQDVAVEQKVAFHDAESTEKVQPHKRDATNIAILRVNGQNSTPLPFAADDNQKAGDVAIALGEKADQTHQKTGELRLYSQQSELTAPGVLGVGGFATWTGGPVLNSDGQVTGLIVEVKPDTMRLVPPSRIKEAAGN